jgi:hypothetical protein
MHSITKYTLILATLGLGFGSTGCLLSGNYHSAKTLGKGESSFGTTFSATTYEVVIDETTGDVGRFTLPSLLPELTFHVGLQDNLEIGGRVGLLQLAMEGDVKYRFLHSDKLHLAIAPAVSVQSLILINGLTFKLPVVATYELSDNVAFTGSVFGSSTNYSSPNDPNDSGDGLGAFQGNLAATGASFNLEFSGNAFAVRPGVEYTNYVASFDGENFNPFSTISIFVHLQFTFGKTKKQLDRIENKLDNMMGNDGPGAPQ